LSITCIGSAEHRLAEISARVRRVGDKYDLPYTTGSLLVQYGKAWRIIAKLSLPNKHRSDSADDAPENPQREDVRRARAGIRRDRPGNRRGLKTAMATVRQWRRRRRTPLRLRAFTLGESLDLAVLTNSPEFVGRRRQGGRGRPGRNCAGLVVSERVQDVRSA
jgi:hypothetical protein